MSTKSHHPDPKAHGPKPKHAHETAHAKEVIEEQMRTVEDEVAVTAPKAAAKEAIDQTQLVKAHDAKANPAAALKASTPGHTLCRVTGTPIKYRGRVIAEGTVAEFEDATVLEMPAVLVSVE